MKIEVVMMSVIVHSYDIKITLYYQVDVIMTIDIILLSNQIVGCKP